MGETTKIEWCDATWNPWIGCQKVSAACDNCYAEALMDKRYKKVEWGPYGDRKLTSVANWRKPFKWAKDARGKEGRPRVFCASLADWLDNQVPLAWRIDLIMLIEDTPELDWLLLTKRIENFRRLAPRWHEQGCPPNVWLGATCENQKAYNRAWPILQRARAPVRFISCEPMLGRLDLGVAAPFPDWIICGGESGPNARTMKRDWAYDLRLQCENRDVAFFMKQMTKRAPIPDELMLREFPI